MWWRLISQLWRRLPKRARRWGVLLTEARFTVTTGAVVVDEQGRVLLLQHRFRAGSGWGIPGGFLQAGEQPEAALRRELREELGAELESLELSFARALETYQQVELIFRCRIRGDVFPQALEVQRAAWFAVNELPVDLSADQRALIARAMRSAGPSVNTSR